MILRFLEHAHDHINHKNIYIYLVKMKNDWMYVEDSSGDELQMLTITGGEI